MSGPPSALRAWLLLAPGAPAEENRGPGLIAVRWARWESEVLSSAMSRDFPGGPVAKTSCSQCRRPGFNPWSGN